MTSSAGAPHSPGDVIAAKPWCRADEAVLSWAESRFFPTPFGW